MHNLYLLRHGRSLADDENKFEGRYDSPLTDVGRAQGTRTSEYLKEQDITFDKILTSPLIRAKETAEIINDSRNLPLIEEPLLMEKDNGILAGESKEGAEEKYPVPNFLSPFRYAPENTGENDIQLHARAGLALSKIIEQGEGSYLIVSHGDLLNALVRNIFGISIPVNRSGHSFRFGDNSLMHLQYDEVKHNWVFCSLNHNHCL